MSDFKHFANVELAGKIENKPRGFNSGNQANFLVSVCSENKKSYLIATAWQGLAKKILSEFGQNDLVHLGGEIRKMQNGHEIVVGSIQKTADTKQFLRVNLQGNLIQNQVQYGKTKDFRPFVKFFVEVKRPKSSIFFTVKPSPMDDFAANCLENLKTGDFVKISGELRTCTYTKDGVKTHGLEIFPDDVEKFGGENEKL